MDRREFLRATASDPKHAPTLAGIKKRMEALMVETKVKEFWDMRIAAGKAAK